jgi:hypothetical protein
MNYFEHQQPSKSYFSTQLFHTVIAFKANNLDASDATSDFLKPLMVHHIFEMTPLMTAVDRAVSEDFLRHSDICVATQGQVFMVLNAPLRSRPNGFDIECCNQPRKYVVRKKAYIKFKCESPSHTGSGRYMVVKLDTEHRVVELAGPKGPFRFIVKEVPV